MKEEDPIEEDPNELKIQYEDGSQETIENKTKISCTWFTERYCALHDSKFKF